MKELQMIFKLALDYSGKLTEEDTQETIDGWDSLSHLALIIELEEFYDRRFTPEQIRDMRTVKGIIKNI